MSIKKEIIRKSLAIVGSAPSSAISGNRHSKAEILAEEFIDASIEEIFLSVNWDFAIKQVRNITGSADKFTAIDGIDDCLKMDMITPSNIEWYIDSGVIYFKGSRLDNLFYHSGKSMHAMLSGAIVVPASFKFLAALSLVGQISFALYSDSIFTEGIRKQFLLKLQEVRQIYSLDCNIVNSGKV